MTYNLNTPISKYFYIRDVLQSATATKHDIKEQFEPPSEIIENASEFAKKILDPLCEYLEYVPRINSWYRCKRVNELVGGVPTSQHQLGLAIDFDDIYGNDVLEAKIIKSGIKFDQLINERGGKWLHLSYANEARMQRFAMKNRNLF